jgi:hypothetical protein
VPYSVIGKIFGISKSSVRTHLKHYREHGGEAGGNAGPRLYPLKSIRRWYSRFSQLKQLVRPGQSDRSRSSSVKPISRCYPTQSGTC